MVDIRPIRIPGRWSDGRALDVHTVRSTYVGDDEFGHPRFETQRSAMGELLYRLKYKGDRSVVAAIAEAATAFVRSWQPPLEMVVTVPRLDDAVRRRLSRIVEKRLPVLIGDANGADKVVQWYLRDCAFDRVEAYAADASPRNNLGGWPVRVIRPPGTRRGFEYYAAKDRALSSLLEGLDRSDAERLRASAAAEGLETSLAGQATLSL